MTDIISLKDHRSTAGPLLEMIEGSVNLMRAYVDLDFETEIIKNGQPVDQHVHGPPSYDDVIQTIEATSESRDCYFRQLGAMVPRVISQTEFERLFSNYEKLRLKCQRLMEEDRREDLRNGS